MKNLKKEKKGTSHVEVIMSFIIFISFITFMMIIFNPFKAISANTSVLSVAESKIVNYVYSNLTVSSVILNSSFNSNAGCIYARFPSLNKIVVKDTNGEIVNANRTTDDVYLEYAGERVYRIYSSEELEEKNFVVSGCYKLDESNYTIGITRNYKRISYSNLVKLNEDYNNNYEQLKKNLNLTNDFTFVIREGSVVMFEGSRYKPRGINLIAKDIPIEILDKNATLNNAILNLLVWS